MLFTISSVMSTGAGRLGISAVVMMMSTSLRLRSEERHFRGDERRAHFLGVAAAAFALFLDAVTSRNSAPMLLT